MGVECGIREVSSKVIGRVLGHKEGGIYGETCIDSKDIFEIIMRVFSVRLNTWSVKRCYHNNPWIYAMSAQLYREALQ